MPALEVADLYQYAVLWPATGFSGFGDPAVGPPVQLDPTRGNGVRWTQRRTVMVNPQGIPTAFDAAVDVATKILPNSIMWLGMMVDLPANPLTPNAFAGNPSSLHIVKGWSNTPDERARVFRQTLGLMRYKDSLPSPKGG